MIICLTGDGREIGGRHSTSVAVNFLHDELLHHCVSQRSPKECFPVVLFYEGDSPDNPEENLTSPTSKINEFLVTSTKSQYGVYFADDEMFMEAGLDRSGTLSPKSASDWNIYRTQRMRWLIACCRGAVEYIELETTATDPNKGRFGA